jgi:hypothetical protein
VREQENRFAFSGAVIADDEILFLGIGAAEKDVGVGKPGRFETSGGGFGDGSGRAGSEAGGNFDELFVDVAGKLFFGVAAGGLGV